MRTIIGLHGFLGSPSDWNAFENVIAYPIAAAENFYEWAKNFNRWVEANTDGPRTLVGYSMGGRLGLQALLQNPSLWSRAVLISTHPGLEDEQEKLARIESDAVWAKRFREDPWELLMDDWERQPIFKDSIRLNRKDGNREMLARQLECFSLGRQEDFRLRLESINVPIQWVTGSKDVKFEQLAKEVIKHHTYSAHRSLEGSHRVIFEVPHFFSLIN